MINDNLDDPNRSWLIDPQSGPEDSYQNSLRPSLLDEYIGQEKVRENLSIAISAAKEDLSLSITYCFTAHQALEKPLWQRLSQKSLK